MPAQSNSERSHLQAGTSVVYLERHGVSPSVSIDKLLVNCKSSVRHLSAGAEERTDLQFPPARPDRP